VLETVFGIPAHPLIVHAAVVFVPLQILAAFAYAFVPFVRRFIVWLVIGLAVVAPVSVFLAKESGDAFQERLIRNGMAPPALLDQIKVHDSYASTTVIGSIGLSALMVLLVLVQMWRSRPTTSSEDGKTDKSQRTKSPIVVAAVLTVAVLAVGVTTGYYIFKTGDTGAHMVWGTS
jgi:heme/copper-type cytochrome/quinol oxidase subunit 2